jgi:pyruvate/2-oxoglutarate dehydrogenase complex dihydrolipoamide acyltransferase (E2) component
MSSSAAEPTSLRLDEALFENSLEQEAILLSWLKSGGAWVERGQHIAEVLVEDIRHEIVAPVSGRLIDLVPACTVLEPGDELCRIAPAAG